MLWIIEIVGIPYVYRSYFEPHQHHQHHEDAKGKPQVAENEPAVDVSHSAFQGILARMKRHLPQCGNDAEGIVDQLRLVVVASHTDGVFLMEEFDVGDIEIDGIRERWQIEVALGRIGIVALFDGEDMAR